LEQLEANIKETKRQATRLEREIESMKNDVDVDWVNLAKKINDLKSYNEGVILLEGLKEELF